MSLRTPLPFFKHQSFITIGTTLCLFVLFTTLQTSLPVPISLQSVIVLSLWQVSRVLI